ncbi:MAG: heavy metal resistance protein [Alphaproteobacteria bacterium]|nr:MAG: heavy metal resistance protein [Alphaproteobacteria bacterium]
MNVIKRVIFFSLSLLLIIAAGFGIGEYFSNNYAKNITTSHQHFHEKLNFTPEQIDKLIPIEKKYAEQKSLYENQIRRANMELGDIMKKEKAYTPEVQAAVEKVHVAMGYLQEITLIHFFDMRVLLDERQKRVLDDYVTDAMHEH